MKQYTSFASCSASPNLPSFPSVEVILLLSPVLALSVLVQRNLYCNEFETRPNTVVSYSPCTVANSLGILRTAFVLVSVACAFGQPICLRAWFSFVSLVLSSLSIFMHAAPMAVLISSVSWRFSCIWFSLGEAPARLPHTYRGRTACPTAHGVHTSSHARAGTQADAVM